MSTAAIYKTIEVLRPLQTRLKKPNKGEWLAEHREAGQTFKQYHRSQPVVMTTTRKKIYVQPIGKFNDSGRKILKQSAEFLSIYFNCEMVILKDLDLDEIPERARRRNPYSGQLQLLSTYILDDLLAPVVPKDAAAVIAFSSTDLWPGRGWNFVFGQASLQKRVGVWSLSRHGDPSTSTEAYQLALQRSIKVATHETGHMFSIAHCTHYSCNMQGSNSLGESDKQPIAVCNQCMGKILYATAADPVVRYQKLIAFCQKNKLQNAHKRYLRLLKRLQKK